MSVVTLKKCNISAHTQIYLHFLTSPFKGGIIYLAEHPQGGNMNREILLRENEIADNLKSTSLSVRVYDTVTSTSDLVRQAAEEGAPEGLVIIAKNQSAGRGRIGKSFFSPTGGLYMSILLRPKITATELLTVTPLAAVSVSEAIEAVTGKRTEIKWVNDLYLKGKKICGILTESALNTKLKALDYAVIGIGINIRRCEFPEEIRDIATSIEGETGKIIDRNELCGEILGRLEYYLENIENKAHLGEYRRRELLTGNYITANTGGETVEGFAAGIDDNANLILRLADGNEKSLFSGEANLCRIRRQK